MRTIRTKVYSFEELSEETQQKVLSNMYDINVGFNWWENIYEDAKQIGIDINSFDIDRGGYCNIELIDSAEYTAYKIIEQHGETCDTYILAKQFLKNKENTLNNAERDENREFTEEYKLDADLDDLEADFKKDLENSYISLLKDEYEYQTSQEAIKEAILSNEYEFTIDGKQF